MLSLLWFSADSLGITGTGGDQLLSPLTSHLDKIRSHQTVYASQRHKALHRISTTSMPSKRSSYASDTSSKNENPRKRRRYSDSSAHSDSDDEGESLKVYIVQAKLAAEVVEEMYSLIETASALNFESVSNAKDASIVITNVHMRGRLERHIPWDIAVSRGHAISRPI